MQTPTATTIVLPATMQAVRERQGLWLMVAGGVLLGSIGVFVEEAGQHPLVTVWFRCAFGALALLLWSAATGKMQDLRLGGASLAVACATGCLMLLNWTLFFAAISRTSMGVATVVFHIQPIWVILFSAIFLREPVSKGQWLATPVALCGLALTTGLLDDMASARSASSEYMLGLLLCMGASLCYAAVTLLSKSKQAISPFALSFWQCGVGAVVLAWAPFSLGWPQQPSAWLWLAGLGVIHTGLAYVILFAGMARLTFGKIAVLQFVYPLAAVLFDWAVYGTRLSVVQLVGVALMGASVWTIRKPSGKSSLSR
ncbi:DMT family transporter [Rhodoferax aquaticus]|uniref:EamA family transporter n=1 Tax=Rhodoferax aquaticus TaxID=2527691 RepID=A0A515ET88_9BURK|nr:EamA family transporter [Rhodoferax aquaticus]QDL55885.1 EamA family transporter [Rhodoferax aquaticus]